MGNTFGYIIFQGSLASILISIFSIYEYILLANDGQTQSLKLILYTWLISKILSFHKIRFNHDECKFICYRLLDLVFLLILQCEWYYDSYSCFKTDINKVIKQLLFLTIPISVVNIQIISDLNRDTYHIYYIIMIAINFGCFWYFIIFLIMNEQEIVPKQTYTRIFSMLSNISFWYMFSQALLYQQYVCFSLMIINSLIAALDFYLFKSQRKEDEWWLDIEKNIFSYIFQVNIYNFQTYPENCKKFQLASLMSIMKLSTQQFNIFILFAAKLCFFPLLTTFDMIFYLIFVLSLPQLYLLGINAYYKVVKQEKVMCFLNSDRQPINDSLFQALEDRFTQEFILGVEIKTNQIERFNSQQIKDLKKLMNIAQERSKNNFKILIFDKEKSYQILFHQEFIIDLYQIKNFIINLTNTFLRNEENHIFFGYLRYLLIQDTFFEINIKCPLSNLKEVQNLLISTQPYFENKFLINGVFNPILSMQLWKLIHLNLQILAFDKSLKQFLPINPSYILYDLYQNYS